MRLSMFNCDVPQTLSVTNSVAVSLKIVNTRLTSFLNTGMQGHRFKNLPIVNPEKRIHFHIILIQTVLATDTGSQTNWDQDPDPG
jgi:hypothetical protein